MSRNRDLTAAHHVLQRHCQGQASECLDDLWVLGVNPADLVHYRRVLLFRVRGNLLHLLW